MGAKAETRFMGPMFYFTVVPYLNTSTIFASSIVCLFCYAVIRRTTKTWLDILTRLYLNVYFKYLKQLCIKFWNKEVLICFHLER